MGYDFRSRVCDVDIARILNEVTARGEWPFVQITIDKAIVIFARTGFQSWLRSTTGLHAPIFCGARYVMRDGVVSVDRLNHRVEGWICIESCEDDQGINRSGHEGLLPLLVVARGRGFARESEMRHVDVLSV